jgi:hypothetical protein
MRSLIKPSSTDAKATAGRSQGDTQTGKYNGRIGRIKLKVSSLRPHPPVLAPTPQALSWVGLLQGGSWLMSKTLA